MTEKLSTNLRKKLKNYCRTTLILFALALVQVTYGQERLKILCYNIHHANPPGEDESTIDLEAIAKVINDSDADLVALQEVDVQVPRSGEVDQAAELAKQTNRHHYFAKGIDLQGGEYGVAILSKKPFLSTESYLLPMPETSEQRVIAIVGTETNSGRRVDFSTSHFDLKPLNKIANAQFVKDLAEQRKVPLIFTGDLNATPDSEPIQLLDQQFVRSQTEEGSTFPQINPDREIDYIMVSKNADVEFINHEVIEEEYASDHRPLVVEIEFKN